MLRIKMTRVYQGSEGTFGVIHDPDGIPFALTAERPWKNNERSESCIPSDVYICKRINSPTFGNTFEVTNVPNRTHILFHKGNVPIDDSKGCILIGEQFEPLSGKMAVLSSKKGYGEFMKLLEGEGEFELVILNSWTF